MGPTVSQTKDRWSEVRRKWGMWSVYFCLRVVICVVQAIPIEACDRLARGLAWLIHDVLRIRAKLVDENLQHAFPDRSPAQRRAMALAMWRHVILMGCELAQGNFFCPPVPGPELLAFLIRNQQSTAEQRRTVDPPNIRRITG